MIEILNQYFAERGVASLLRVLTLIVIGLPVVYAVSAWAKKYITSRFTPQQGMITGKGIKYFGVMIILLTLFHELGFKLAPLLGAAGILGIAIGFASQTSVSNIISGIFLIVEKPFVVGDVISVGDIQGEILSIDMLSIKLRTFDNRFVRIPNETLIKSPVTNVTYFPIRRADLKISVAYKEDIARVRKVLLELANKNPLCLQEPEPLVIFQEFGDSSINFTFAVWTQRTDFLKLRNSLQDEIKARFDQEGIEIPFPQRTLWFAQNSKPSSGKSEPSHSSPAPLR